MFRNNRKINFVRRLSCIGYNAIYIYPLLLRLSQYPCIHPSTATTGGVVVTVFAVVIVIIVEVIAAVI